MEKLSSSLNRASVTPAIADLVSRPPVAGNSGGVEFREKLEALQRSPAESTAKSPVHNTALKFSNHAVDRMQSRGIHFSPDEMSRIEGAVSKAASKGSRDALLISDNAALIVSVKDKTVVTVMDKSSLKENVFTNIDSTVMI